MSEKIKPAVSAKQWREAGTTADSVRRYETYVGDSADAAAYLVALNNAVLPDADARKLTRGRLSLLRRAAVATRDGLEFEPVDLLLAEMALSFINALESYLPPEA